MFSLKCHNLTQQTEAKKIIFWKTLDKQTKKIKTNSQNFWHSVKILIKAQNTQKNETLKSTKHKYSWWKSNKKIVKVRKHQKRWEKVKLKNSVILLFFIKKNAKKGEINKFLKWIERDIEFFCEGERWKEACLDKKKKKSSEKMRKKSWSEVWS